MNALAAAASLVPINDKLQLSSMSSTNPVKILTVGSAVGSIRELFAKVKAIDAKHGKFDLLLCTGDFFGPIQTPGENAIDDEVSQLLLGHIEAPIECYVMQGDQPLPEKVVEKFAKTGGELCKNVFLMSKSGTITTAHGLRIACLGGTYEPTIYSSSEAAPGFLSPFFARQTIERLLANSLTKASSKKSYTSLAAIQSTATDSQVIDIFLSNVWPASITQQTTAPLPDPQLSSLGAPPLDEAVTKTRPRYHFAAAGGSPPKFWEREPFVWEGEDARITRFVSLGAFGNEPATGKKQRWFYAFTISPITPTTVLAPKPANATRNPFTSGVRRNLGKRQLDDTAENFIWGAVNQGNKRTKVIPQGELGKPPPGYKCRRCESTDVRNIYGSASVRSFSEAGPISTLPAIVPKDKRHPKVTFAKYAIRDAVGDTGGKKPKPGYNCRACGSENHYLEDCPQANQSRSSRPERGSRRGPPKEISSQIIPTHQDDYTAQVPGGGHLLIVPITHYPTFSTIPSDIAKPIIDETESYKTALRSMYEKFGAAAVVFEVGRLSAKGGHAHVQVVPIPLKLKDRVEETFIKEGTQMGIDFESDPDAALEACQGGRGSYFRVDLPDGRKMVHVMKDHIPFSIQFGRQVLVSLLDMPDRFDWKACMLSEEDDRADAQAFKTAFAPFDPSL
ncbi:nuclear protein [Ephemerocybe angulata]|uniref:Nuclear protein n=1 Tax=Ephemerocybe angulata TaxID=980116 RepID=A0A8H6IGI1_9AGAR|nr:nuclear protein [Tulosesus angulatus]